MGNQPSSSSSASSDLKAKPVNQVIDYIATHYIMNMNFQALQKLYKKEYCDKLVILTSDIIQRYFTDMEITYLAQRVRQGVEVNELEKDKVIFFDRDDLDRLDIQTNLRKKRMCMGIAKFYVRIAHIFAAIVTTINPTYLYRDAEGQFVEVPMYEKDQIPSGTKYEVQKLNICDNRIRALERGFQKDGDDVTLHPDVCTFMQSSGEPRTLQEEPGIPELEQLYYDDKYDFETGQFTAMSYESRRRYEQDLRIFYKTFSDGDEVPSDIKKFSDIGLRNMMKKEGCRGSHPPLDAAVRGSDKLFVAYADNLKQMIRHAKSNQEKLLSVINRLFVYTVDPQSGKKVIRVNPQLTEDGLQQLTVETREIIIRLYLVCEMDYLKGVQIYEAIVEKQILETAQRQIDSLQQTSDMVRSDQLRRDPRSGKLSVVDEEQLQEQPEQEQEQPEQDKEKAETTSEEENGPVANLSSEPMNPASDEPATNPASESAPTESAPEEPASMEPAPEKPTPTELGPEEPVSEPAPAPTELAPVEPASHPAAAPNLLERKGGGSISKKRSKRKIICRQSKKRK
jgi:hypothetical protein